MELEGKDRPFTSVPPNSPKGQWILFLLIGCLSMLYAELFSGASRMWFFNVWSLSVTYPLYLVHVLFFLNLAFRTNKTSPPHLYLWGTLFGMYESWITQVLWVGYDTGGPMVGSVLGIGIGEFLALIFFWHPILSFVLPVFIFELLALSKPSEIPSEQRILPSHVPFLVKVKSNQKYLWALYVVGSLFMAFNYQGNVLLVLGALGGTYILIYLLVIMARRYSSFSVYSLRIGNVGMTMIVIYLAVLYAFMFVGYGYSSGRIPGILPIATTIVIYSVLSWIIHTSRPAAESVEIPPLLTANSMKLSDYKKFVYFNLLFASGLCLVILAAPHVMVIPFLCFYLLICVIGVYIFYKAVYSRNEQTPESLQNSYAKLTETLTAELQVLPG